METRYLGMESPKEIDTILQNERQRRAFLTNRAELEDLLMVYEPTEAFSIHSQRDMKSARDPKSFRSYLEKSGAPIIETDRGGGMFWHGPGQVCLAPLVDLERIRFNLTDYSDILEETCIKTLEYFGVNVLRNHYMPGSQGAWVQDAKGVKKKIAFFGYSFSRGMAIHGCAINVCPDLYPFSLIDPCNLPGVEVTSMETVLFRKLSVEEVGKIAAEIFIKLFYMVR